MGKVVLQAADLDGYLSAADGAAIARVGELYGRALADFTILDRGPLAERGRAEERLLAVFNELGERMQAVVAAEKRIHVYSFETPEVVHGEVSRLIAKLRDERTDNPEFVYYTQRAYELLFNFAFGGPHAAREEPHHRAHAGELPRAELRRAQDPRRRRPIENSVMCVMLRAALLPSMIMSKEIQEYSSHGYVTPFALFKITRDDTERGRHGVHPGPGPLLLRSRRAGRQGPVLRRPDERHRRQPRDGVKYLARQGVAPRSIKFFNVISVLKGALRIVRAVSRRPRSTPCGWTRC